MDDQKTVVDINKAVTELAAIVQRTIVPAFAELGRVLSEVSREVSGKILDAFSSLFIFDWHRRTWETDSDYAQRLVDDGWLDNPDARWEYQKIVWGTPMRMMRGFFRK